MASKLKIWALKIEPALLEALRREKAARGVPMARLLVNGALAHDDRLRRRYDACKAEEIKVRRKGRK